MKTETKRRNASRGLRATASLIALLLPLNASGHGLGKVDFQASCAASVSAEIDRGVALLHHMMYAQARGVFSQLAENAPDCAMAHWGVAMTLFQPLWPTRPSAEDLMEGRSAVQRAMDLRPATERERALLSSVEGFYRDPGADWWTRISRWSERMTQAHQTRPDDREIAAFYALSQLAVGPVSGDRAAHQARAGEVLAAIHRQEPTHPGAIHYTIHANDVDGRAGQSLDVVRSYSAIAPEVPHALHMPTHIYVRLGEWADVIDWNRRSADAALKFPAGKSISHHYLHAVDYLVYAYLQRGEDEKASAAMAEAFAKRGYQPSFVSAFHLAAIPARYAVERRQWNEAAAIKARDYAGIPWDKFSWPDAMSWFGRGLGLAHGGDLEGAAAAEKAMQALSDKAKSAGEKAFASYIEIDRLILTGAIAQARGQSEEAERSLRSAAQLESTVQKHPVTPGALLPSSEALGDLLLELGRPQEALTAYESSRRTWPGRYNTLLGCARAANEAGDVPKAKACYSSLLEVARQSNRPGSAEAEQYLAGN